MRFTGASPLLVVALALCACDRGSSARMQPEPAPPSSVAETLGVDAAAFVPPVDPSPPAGDLAVELARFSTLDACVKEHAGLDPLLGDALRSVGYETFVRDACRLLEATKAKSVAKCAPIDASALRERCDSYVAMATASPDDCPLLSPDEPSAGRRPTCVAVAARDARLCAAEERAARASCEALAMRDERRCAGAPENAREECRREVSRWKGVLGEARAAGELAEPRGKLTVRAPEGAPPLARGESDLRELLARGVVLVLAADGDRVSVGELRERSASLVAGSPAAEPRVAFSLVLKRESPVVVRVERLELDVPGAPTLACDTPSSCALSAKAPRLERERGGAVQLTLEGPLGIGPGAYALHLEAQTYVRDVVKLGLRARDAGGLPPGR